MLIRVAAVAIVVFWLVMTGLLVRLECFPSAADLLPVPVDHLFKLMFLHEEASNLVLFQGQDRIGDLQLQPHRFPASAGLARNQLAVTGSMTLNLPGIDTRHLTLRGVVELDDQDAARRFELTLTVHEPSGHGAGPHGATPPKTSPSLVIVLEGEPPRDHYHYAERIADSVLAEQSGTLATLLDQPELHSLGLDPATLGGMLQQQAASTQVTARRGILRSKGEDMETYDVTIRQADTVAATVQLSQIGQILTVKTFAGYSLLDETLAP